MSPFLRFLLCALLLGAALPASCLAERIQLFDSEYTLTTRGDLLVRERIHYDFEGAERHGIYRELPLKWVLKSGRKRNTEIKDVEVFDGIGVRRPSRVRKDGQSLEVRIGDADRYVSGLQIYEIRYRVPGAVLFFEEHDELYWNVTGNDWRIPIDRVQATVRLPADRPWADIRSECYTGSRGALEKNCESREASGEMTFSTTQALSGGEGLTIVAGLPKGILEAPSTQERAASGLVDFLLSLVWLPLVALFGMIGLWKRFGRDEEAGRSVAARYSPPEGLRPAEVGMLVDEFANPIDISSIILDLALRNWLILHEIETDHFIFLSKKDHELERRRPDPEGDILRPYEQRLLSSLFKDGDRVSLSELKGEFAGDFASVRNSLRDYCVEDLALFVGRPDKVRKTWLGGGIATAVGGFFIGPYLGIGPTFGLISCGLIVAAFSHIMPRRTRRGRLKHDQIKGYQEFLKRVDEDRLEKMGMRSVQDFEKHLPYAIVLGVADHWADLFDGIYSESPGESPGWYNGVHPGVFDISDLGRSMNGFGKTLSQAPAKGDSGFSGGFGGGGFSGGGGGGGGGGSW